jgi:S1-C subfamily serine protease
MPDADDRLAAMTHGALAGGGSLLAVQSVVRITCAAGSRSGTGFFHKSGNIITAEHVVRGCDELEVFSAAVGSMKATAIDRDTVYDLALLRPSLPFKGQALPIRREGNVTHGMFVTTWGFPSGYSGDGPILSAGYLAGIDGIQTSPGHNVARLTINAAFNSGNSGGPLVIPETGEIFGVVVSKLTPLSDFSRKILGALEAQKSGMTYTLTNPDGTTEKFTEGQLIGRVLNELGDQMQLVIGHAATLGQIKAFLKRNKIDP